MGSAKVLGAIHRRRRAGKALTHVSTADGLDARLETAIPAVRRRGRDARILHKCCSTGDSNNLVEHGYSSRGPRRRLDEWLRALLIAIAHRGNGNEPEHEISHSQPITASHSSACSKCFRSEFNWKPGHCPPEVGRAAGQH